VCHLLDDWSCFDIHRAVGYSLSCLTHEGAFGLAPGGREAHAGATYCAVATLVLTGQLHAPGPAAALDPAARRRLVAWCLRRQCGGFQVSAAVAPASSAAASPPLRRAIGSIRPQGLDF
jgi:geranylgeranyl transferase type-1 subunit beta